VGYWHRFLKATCGSCNRGVLWSLRPNSILPTSWGCECGDRNYLDTIDPRPDVPLSIYIGSEKYRRLKLYPLPPAEYPVMIEGWALPYSIRSFVAQASREYGGCVYEPRRRGEVFGEDVYADRCYDSREDWRDADSHNCHIVAGWTTGETTCNLWEMIAQLCERDYERTELFA